MKNVMKRAALLLIFLALQITATAFGSDPRGGGHDGSGGNPPTIASVTTDDTSDSWWDEMVELLKGVFN